MSRRFAALGAFFVVGIAIAGCGSGVPGNSVAAVAGNAITLRAWHHWLFVAAKSQSAQSPGAPIIIPSDPPKFTSCVAQIRAQVPSFAKAPTKTLQHDCKGLFTQYSNEVMDFLIKAYWYQAEAAKEGIKVTTAEVMKVFNSAKKAQFPAAAQFNQFLSQTGETLPDILYRFRINEVTMKLLKKLTPAITDKQIAAYYAAHSSSFGTPETRDIRIVLTKTQKEALTAKSALVHHQSWAAVAKKYSTDPTTKNTGGLLVNVRKGQDEAALDDAAFAAPVNKLMGPVKGTFGYYIFEVTKITPPTHQTLAQATTAIKATLKQQSSATAQTKLEALVKKHWMGKTTCQPLYAMADCSGFHAPGSTTGTSSSAPSPTATASSTTSATPTTSTK